MAKTVIYPAAIAYLGELTDTMTNMAALKLDMDTSVPAKVAELATALLASAAKLEVEEAKHDFDSTEAHLTHCAHVVRPLMDEVRGHADALEGEVADKHWPLPTYEEMLFIK
jgi:glutamine synthetase